ncbi:MAG: TetR/AcrR family transcriptional regulator [Solirubrobacteraceae bacterium]|nr:TetR/AcrR family transcriptional regulator [Solirubrobacteraceae bacterium]
MSPTHRERLLEAMAESIREHGYRGSTVADVVRRARTSRRTFYEHFADRDACFLALFDAMNDLLSLRIAAALDPTASWQEQVDLAIGAYIDEVVAEPELTLACLREIPALGEAGIACQHQEVERFADLLMALVVVVGETTPEVTPIQRPAAIMLTGGLRELIAYTSRNDADPAELKAAASAVVKSVLDPAHRDWGSGAGAKS